MVLALQFGKQLKTTKESDRKQPYITKFVELLQVSTDHPLYENKFVDFIDFISCFEIFLVTCYFKL